MRHHELSYEAVYGILSKLSYILSSMTPLNFFLSFQNKLLNYYKSIIIIINHVCLARN